MKIAINACYGGFNPSPLIIYHYMKLKGEPCYFYNGWADNPESTLIPEQQITSDKLRNNLTYAYRVPVPREHVYKGYEQYNDTPWEQIPQEVKSIVNSRWDQIQIDCDHIPRNDPDLIRAIELVGSENSTGFCSDIKIVEIPDDVDWVIQEYDGLEWVAERHRTWS